MNAVRVAVAQGRARSRVEIVVGALAPRLIRRGPSDAHVAIAAAQMLLLAGDRVEIEIDVAPGCALEIEDVGGTVAYPGEGPSSQWRIRAHVGDGGLLVWRGLPFVVATGADVERRTELTIGAGADAVMRETLVLGRHGEAGGRIDTEMVVADPRGPVLVERLDVRGGAGAPGLLGSNRVSDAVVAIGFRPRAAAGVLELEEPGALARHLGGAAHESPLDGVADDWARQAWERFNARAVA